MKTTGKSKDVPNARAAPFKAKRHHHLTESAEDYTELVADLIRDKGEARTCEVAKHLGISHVTALRTIRRLARDGYFETAPHRPITLTLKGKRTASLSRKRHDLLVEFFVRLGVPKSVAEIDVEGMEHHISPVTLRAIRQVMKRGRLD